MARNSRYIEDEFSHLPSASSRYYHRHKDKVNQKRYGHKWDNREFWLFKAARARAAKKGIEFNIEIEDIIIPEVCPVFGIPLFASIGAATDNSPSLDRIDNTKGYVKGNVQVLSNKANRLKGDATPEEIKRLAEWLDSSLTAPRPI